MSPDERYARCEALVVGYEGGYVDHPKDPGGPTNMGVTLAALSEWRGHPCAADDVRALGLAEVKAIYRAKYWRAVDGDSLPAGVDLIVFDAAVNTGRARAVLQALSPSQVTVILSAASTPAEARALYAAMTVKPDTIHRLAMNGLIRGEKAAGLWPLIDYQSGLCALHDAQAYRIDWKNPTLVGSFVGSPTFVIDQGPTYNGSSSYEDSGFMPSTATAATASAAFLGVYEGTNLASNAISAGVISSGNNQMSLRPRESAGTIGGSLMSSFNRTTATSSDSRGLQSIIRSAGPTFAAYSRATQVDVFAPGTTNGVLPTANLWIGGENNAGVLTSPRAANIRGVIFGNITAAQLPTLNTLVQACMTAIGAAV